MILTSTQHGQLMTDILQSTNDLSVTIDKSFDTVLDTGVGTEFLYERL